MDLVLDAATIEDLPRPLTVRHHLALEAYRRTGKVPRDFQVDFALALDSGRDVVCIAGTGAGKSLAFIIIHFLREDVITWIISPLNVIENQMAKDYSEYSLRAVAVNASTVTPGLIKDIKMGKYDVIISSPEAYKDQNKLRSALLSKELAHKKHVTIVDEAHCILIWGGTGFREDFKRIGDMRSFMPRSSVMCAATATLSTSAREGVVRSLHIKPEHLSINLGNWRANLRYGVHIMRGGQKSHSEVCDLLDSSIPIKDAGQAIIFAEDYDSVHYITDALRKHAGLSGSEASDLICGYHALLDEQTKRRIERRFREGKIKWLVTSEALTMGANFLYVTLVLNFLSPALLEIWLQRAGRNARLPHLLGRCIVMVTKQNVQKAVKVCSDAGVQVNPVLLGIKAEEDDEPEELTQQDREESTDNSTDSKRSSMSLGMAEYIAVGASGGCLTERQGTEEPDPHRKDREEARGPPTTDKKEDELTHKATRPSAPVFRPTAERKRFLEAILAWRAQKLQDILLVHDYSLEAIMTQKEAERIAKTGGITHTSDFDKPDVKWPACTNLRLELLVILSDLQQTEDQRQLKEEESNRKKAEEEKKKAEDKRRAAEEARQNAVELKPKVKKEKVDTQQSNTAKTNLRVAPSLTRLLESNSASGSNNGSQFTVFQVNLQNQQTSPTRKRKTRSNATPPTPITPNTPSVALHMPTQTHTSTLFIQNSAVASGSQAPGTTPHSHPVGHMVLDANGVPVHTMLHTPDATPKSSRSTVPLVCQLAKFNS
ncbi:DEAD/DEAH box helicase [Ceratobasidium sp. AG-Ba]|nr:DEAD/DEAH box helicase [Ceratobasidium sp. AG-Ba]